MGFPAGYVRSVSRLEGDLAIGIRGDGQSALDDHKNLGVGVIVSGRGVTGRFGEMFDGNVRLVA
jgi:hypothetical protein